MDFEEFLNILNKYKMAHLQKPYQPVTIKELLENDGSCPEEKLIAKIRECDPKEEKQEDRRYKDVLSTEGIKKVTKRKGKDIHLKYKPKNEQEKNELIKVCDEWVSNVKTEAKRKKHGVGSLTEFLGKVDKIQLQVLEEILRLRGKTLSAEKLGHSASGDGRLQSRRVDEKYYLHPLGRGTYTPANSEYTQAIFLNPGSRWKLEIDRKHPTLKINYNFGDSVGPNYQADIKALTACKDIGLPIGVFFQLKKSKYRCLGRCKIISKNKNNFELESEGISDEESAKIKNEVLQEYDELTKDQSVARILNVNYTELSNRLRNNFKDEKITHEVIADREKYKIDELVKRCERTELVIPNFQRFFVWNKEQIRDFLDSIFHRYYIGSLLFWEPTNLNIGIEPVTGVKKDNLNPKQIILDGQQRVSSIYYALRSPDYNIKGGERVFFYIDFHSFLKSDNTEIIKVFNNQIDEEIQFEKLLFPLNKLENYDKWLQSWSKFISETYPELNFLEDIRPIEEKIRDETRHMLKEFGCPFVVLKNVELDGVVDTFERINTTGVTLNAFDLLIAKLSLHKIDLRRLWTEACNEPRSLIKSYFEKSTQGLLILHAMALCFTKSGSCSRKDVLKIFDNMGSDKKDFEDKWRKMVKYTNQAISFLESTTDDGFGVTNKKFLPSESIIPVLAALLRTVNEDFDSNKTHQEKIRFWYWTSALKNMYSGASDTQKTIDYKAITKWFSDDNVPDSISEIRENFPGNMRLMNVERKSSNFNAIICLAAKKGSKDWTQNLGVKNQMDFGKEYKVDIDHVFPKALYRKEDHNESILNKILLLSPTNIKKSKKEPSVVLAEALKNIFKGNEKELLDTLKTHFINENAYAALLDNDHEKFLIERQNEIWKEIAEKIGAKIPDETSFSTQTSPDTSYDNIIIPRNAVENCKEEIFWISKYFSEADLKTIRLGMNNSIKKIRILTSKKQKEIKSEFKRFKEQFSEIECQMKIMNKDVESEIHARYLADKTKCYNMIDTDIAKRGQTDDVTQVKRPKNLEDWWEASYDIFDDWNKF